MLEPEGSLPAERAVEVIPPYQARLQAFTDRPDAMDQIYAHVSNGGDMVTFAQMLDLRMSDVALWINKDFGRVKAYTAAAKAGDEWIKQRVLKELALIGTVDIRRIFRDDGGLLPPNEWPEDVARAISAVDIEELYEGTGRDRQQVGFTKKIKMNDKLRALELIGKDRGMFVQKHSVVVESLEDLVAGSWEEKPNEQIAAPVSETISEAAESGDPDRPAGDGPVESPGDPEPGTPA